MQPDLYRLLVEAGCEIGSHYSDLHVKATPKALSIIRDFNRMNLPVAAIPFRSQIDGSRWLDIPFAYSPYWEKRHARKALPLVT